MNKIFKVVWSKAKNCCVVASELAKRRTKCVSGGVISRAVVVGTLACCMNSVIVYAGSSTIGEVTAFSKDTNPAGYLLCDGRAVSRTQYAALFAEIGTKYGAGDGSTTFNLPNLVNRFVEGSTTSGQYIEAGLPNITGKTGGTGVNSDSPTADGAFYKYGEGIGVDDNDGDNHLIAFDASRSNSIYGNSNTVQPNALTMRYFIKAVDDSLTVGSVASGDEGVITGDTAYTELRSSANGNYVNAKNSLY